jgi:hypothetical protein
MAHPDPRPVPDASPAPAHGTPGVLLLPLANFAAELRALDPPVAYRVGLDTGLEFNNVRHALAQPGATRLSTWGRIMASLGAELRAVADARPVPDAGVVPFPLAGPAHAAALRPLVPGVLAARRAFLHMSRRELARDAGVCVGTVDDLEAGCGFVRNLDRVCGAMGLALRVALSRGEGSVAQMWERRAAQLLARPAQFAARAPALQPSALSESAAAMARRSAPLSASLPGPWGPVAVSPRSSSRAARSRGA